MPYDRRLSLLKKSSGMNEDYIEEYKKGEVIRNAIAGVRKTAAVNEAARLSPKKLYGGVRSKIAGNVKSIKKTQKRTQLAKAISDMDNK